MRDSLFLLIVLLGLAGCQKEVEEKKGENVLPPTNLQRLED